MTHWPKLLLLSCFAFLLPMKPLIIGAFVAVLFDTITGIMAAHKRGEKITSAGLRRMATKSLVYSIAIIAGFVIQTTLLGNLIPVAHMVAGACGISEAKSIFENLNTVLGMPVFSAIMSKLSSPNDPRNKQDETPSEPS